MSNNRGIKFKILLNSLLSVFIFAMFLVYISNIYWNELLDSKKEKLQNIVEVGSTIVSHFIDLEKKSILPKEEAQNRAKDTINSIRYSGKEYIFITNTKAYQVLNPVKPELSGKDMSGFTDPNGVKLFVEIANVAKKSGKGYVEYMFPKAGSTTPSKKLSYVNYFPEWDWIIGTGLYMDDAYEAMTRFLEILLFACLFCIATLIFIGIYFANSVVKPLTEVCLSLLNSSESLFNKSNELKNSSSSVIKYSKEQESSIQTTAAAISEITSMIGKTTELTSNSATLANNISGKAEDGEVSMKNMITSMQGIHEASSKLKEIENIINQIESKTQVINKIVSKTELLSLNASIEAARAGEHGKGFSVVAEEVGNLAHMSGKSSSEIQALLQRSREEVQRILVQTIDRVEDGQKRTLKVSAAFSDIVNGIKEINFQMGQVSDATKEQEIGVKQISVAMGQLDQLALKNTVESENSLKSTEDISTESNNLNEIVEKTEIVIFGNVKKLK
ncbi:methyl-accepting chemotaxis protein [Silvanigrella sp.]|jgi:methyl-accepting chemotaxis protein|uniref:methyl-accepting chemotaxis protein n=1 Tax=Silvanigrella sp. TaxID=2024976 RepID=UPI0037CA63F3